MNPLLLLRYPRLCDGRVITKDHFTEAEALRIFPDAERVDDSRVVVEDCGHVGWGFASGLVRREDGAKVQRSEDAASA